MAMTPLNYSTNIEEPTSEISEPTEQELEHYLNDIISILENIKITTLTECKMFEQILKAFLIPSCAYLVAARAAHPATHSVVLPLAQRLHAPEHFVLSAGHENAYKEVITDCISQELSRLSIFKQKAQRDYLEKVKRIPSMNSVQFKIYDFNVAVERLNRDMEISIPLTKALEKIRDERIDAVKIAALPQAELNRLVFDGNSAEALAILNKISSQSNVQLTIN